MDGKHCRKTAWGCIVLAYSVIALGILCSRREGSGVAVQVHSDETPPIDLLLLYCVRRPTVFSRFLVCQSHKPKESNVQLCSISKQNFSEHSFAVKNSPTGMQFLLHFHRFRRLLNSATTALSSRIDAGPQRVFAFPQDVVSQASKASPEMSNYRLC